MNLSVKLEQVDKGYTIVRESCPWCGSGFVFRIKDKTIHDAIGDGEYSPNEKVARCKTCMSKFKCSTDEPKLTMR